jgi:c-di-GMP-binding flagellar brake protein YcgR
MEEAHSKVGPEERRVSKRFRLRWRAKIKGVDSSGRRFEVSCLLEDISSGGAYMLVEKPDLFKSGQIAIGSKLEVAIRIPLKKERWMSYAAEVVRAESLISAIGLGVRFSGHRPTFQKFMTS